MTRPAQTLSLVALALSFGIDRLHKFLQVSAECMAEAAACHTYHAITVGPPLAGGWRGGEIVPVTPFFDYVLVWNTGVSYGLLADLPVWGLGAIAAFAIALLGLWWWKSSDALVRVGLACCIGGALSNALDRLLYGAVADFFHFHWQDWSFYIFNVADMAITLGVVLLVLDLVGIGRRKAA
jgi:signal peptidase II